MKKLLFLLALLAPLAFFSNCTSNKEAKIASKKVPVAPAPDSPKPKDKQLLKYSFVPRDIKVVQYQNGVSIGYNGDESYTAVEENVLSAEVYFVDSNSCLYRIKFFATRGLHFYKNVYSAADIKPKNLDKTFTPDDPTDFLKAKEAFTTITTGNLKNMIVSVVIDPDLSYSEYANSGVVKMRTKANTPIWSGGIAIGTAVEWGLK